MYERFGIMALGKRALYLSDHDNRTGNLIEYCRSMIIGILKEAYFSTTESRFLTLRMKNPCQSFGKARGKAREGRESGPARRIPVKARRLLQHQNVSLQCVVTIILRDRL